MPTTGGGSETVLRYVSSHSIQVHEMKIATFGK